MPDELLTVFLIAGGCGVVGSLLALIGVRFGNPGPDLRVGNATGVGFLVGAATGAVIGIFETLIGRL